MVQGAGATMIYSSTVYPILTNPQAQINAEYMKERRSSPVLSVMGGSPAGGHCPASGSCNIETMVRGGRIGTVISRS
jgi:hypothetical protein